MKTIWNKNDCLEMKKKILTQNLGWCNWRTESPSGWFHIDGWVQDCSDPIANAMDLLQSCTKPSIYRCLLINIENILVGIRRSYDSLFSRVGFPILLRWNLYIKVGPWLPITNTIHWSNNMMTSSNGNIFRVTDHLCGEFTGPRWILRTKASDVELWCFLWSASE